MPKKVVAKLIFQIRRWVEILRCIPSLGNRLWTQLTNFEDPTVTLTLTIMPMIWLWVRQYPVSHYVRSCFKKCRNQEITVTSGGTFKRPVSLSFKRAKRRIVVKKLVSWKTRYVIQMGGGEGGRTVTGLEAQDMYIKTASFWTFKKIHKKNLYPNLLL